MLGEKDATRLEQILNVLYGRGRRIRGKGLYLARSIALRELKELVLFHGAENVKESARKSGWTLLKDNVPPEQWEWVPLPNDEEIARRTRKKPSPTEEVKKEPITHEQVYQAHHKNLDVERGQTCACSVCVEYREKLKKEKEEGEEPSRWSLLEID